LSANPLFELSNDREVRQAKGFRRVASELNGEKLNELYQQARERAPHRSSVGRKFLVGPKAKRPSERKSGRDEEHLSIALFEHWSAQGGKVDIPGCGAVEILSCKMPVRTAAPDRALGLEDPNAGLGNIDLLGLHEDGRLVIVMMRYLEPDATRGGTGDTPLRNLLRALAHVAVVDGNRADLALELEDHAISDEAPILVMLASPRYWELCRKREAQKGAAWIRELDRLAREVALESGVEIFYGAVELEGNPGWSYGDKGPELLGDPKLSMAWEPGAGKLKPKPKSKPKAEEDPVIEADLSRPVRQYALTESFEPGDRIAHPKLGEGVVQGGVGPGKIAVLFGERKALLVHERSA